MSIAPDHVVKGIEAMRAAGRSLNEIYDAYPDHAEKWIREVVSGRRVLKARHISDEEVVRMRRMLAAGVRRKQIVLTFSEYSQAHVYQILAGTARKEVGK